MGDGMCERQARRRKLEECRVDPRASGRCCETVIEIHAVLRD
jgi:hypothetical protein